MKAIFIGTLAPKSGRHSPELGDTRLIWRPMRVLEVCRKILEVCRTSTGYLKGLTQISPNFDGFRSMSQVLTTTPATSATCPWSLNSFVAASRPFTLSTEIPDTVSVLTITVTSSLSNVVTAAATPTTWSATWPLNSTSYLANMSTNSVVGNWNLSYPTSMPSISGITFATGSASGSKDLSWNVLIMSVVMGLAFAL